MLRVSSKRTCPEGVTLVTVVQRDLSGVFEVEVCIWEGLKDEERKFLCHCENLSGRWPKSVLDRFSALRLRCSRPEASLRNKLVEHEYKIELTEENDDEIKEEEDEDDEEEEVLAADSEQED